MPIGDFTEQAEAYHGSRPSYPEAMLDALDRRLPLTAPSSVADIGAGTGILTGQLAARGQRVEAVEPNAAMRAFAAPHPQVRWSAGTFEATGLPAASQRWVVAAQAFHWADPPRALPELARVLAPGGALTLLFNDRDHAASELMTFVREAIAREVPGFDEAYRNRDWAEVLAGGGHFGDVWYHETPHVVTMTRARFIDLWRGHNRLNNIAGPERFGRLMAAIEQRLSERGLDEVPVHYRCRAWTAWRLPRAAGPGMSTG